MFVRRQGGTHSAVVLDEVEVEHILHESGCAIHHHTIGVRCDCGAASWFEIMPRKDYEAMLPKGTSATPEGIADDLVF